MEATVPGQKIKKPRSPSYPGIGLEAAIQRTRDMFGYQRREPSSVDLILQRWGYKPKSGAGLVILAALKKFGLVEDEGSGDRRKAQLSPLALTILLDETTDGTQRAAAIRTAALNPAIHRELWDRYDGYLPDDGALRTYLLLERNFTDTAVKDFIPQFRQTLVFSGLTDGTGNVSRQEQDTPRVEENTGMSGARTQNPPPPPPPGGDELAIPVLLAGGKALVKLHGTFPVTPDQWDRMIALLDAHKAGLVTSPEPEPDPE